MKLSVNVMLPDVLSPNLKLVICGTAAGSRSAALQQYYAGRGNKFWKTLFEVGLTPELLYPYQYKDLLKYDIGLTDLVKSKSGMDFNLDSSDFGSDQLVKKIKRYKPRYICFNGKRAAKEFFLREVDYGLQIEMVDNTKFYVAPSTSSAAGGFWDIEKWHEIALLCNS